MGIFDKLKEIVGGEEDEDIYEPDVLNGAAGEYDYVSEREEPVMSKSGKSSKASRAGDMEHEVFVNAKAQLKVVLVKPEQYTDAAGIADHLMEKRTVVLNLESTNEKTSRRIIDFLTGVAYASRGNVKRAANNTYVITPDNVGIMGVDIMDELESSGVFL